MFLSLSGEEATFLIPSPLAGEGKSLPRTRSGGEGVCREATRFVSPSPQPSPVKGEGEGASCHGFSLIEVLIALVIIMIGLLGVAGLQAVGVRSSAQAHLRTLAALDAHSLAATMRANRIYWTDASTPATIAIKATAKGTVSVTPAIASPVPDCAASNCTAQETAAYDLAHWGELLADMQRNTQATITRIANAGTSASAYEITVNWNERRIQGQGATAAAETHSTSVVVQP